MNETRPGCSPSDITENLTTEQVNKLKSNSVVPANFNRLSFNPSTGLGLLYRPFYDETPRETFMWEDREVEFVDYWPTNKKNKPMEIVRACYTKVLNPEDCTVIDLKIPIRLIDVKILKAMELWNYLPADLQKTLEETVVAAYAKAEASKPGKKRDPETANLPRELKCCTEDCEGKMPYISPTMLIAAAEKKGVSPEEYAATWKCSRCEPRRHGWVAGVANPDFVGIPKKTNCSVCGKEICLFPQNVVDRAKELNISTEEFVKSYKCRSCGKKDREMNGTTTTKTTTTRGRKPNPEFVGLPEEMVCKCGNKVPTNPNYLKAKALKNNTTIQKLIENFVCQVCVPSRGRPRKVIK